MLKRYEEGNVYCEDCGVFLGNRYEQKQRLSAKKRCVRCAARHTQDNKNKWAKDNRRRNKEINSKLREMISVLEERTSLLSKENSILRNRLAKERE